jgi:hypothetical protein
VPIEDKISERATAKWRAMRWAYEKERWVCLRSALKDAVEAWIVACEQGRKGPDAVVFCGKVAGGWQAGVRWRGKASYGRVAASRMEAETDAIEKATCHYAEVWSKALGDALRRP